MYIKKICYNERTISRKVCRKMKKVNSDEQQNKKQELQMSKKKKEVSTKKQSTKEADDDGLQIVSFDNIDDMNGPTPRKKSYVFGRTVRIVIIVIAAVVFGISGYQIFSIFSEYKQGEDLYDDLADSFTTVDINSEDEEDEGENYIDGDILPYKKVEVDFDGLKKSNKDVVGWIQFEHVDISYPIVRGEDNSFYLNHTVTKTENKAGAIFMDYKNAKDFSDMNTIIYGHNMKNGSMFGLMGKYKNAEFYLGRDCFWIYTPTADYRYVIFSCYEPKADDENVYSFWSEPCDAYGEYLQKAKEAGKYSTPVADLSQGDKIVTLSTCTSRGSDYRFVVQGKLIETIQK